MKKLLIIFFVTQFTAWAFAQQVPNVKNSWLGNSSPDYKTFMPQGLDI